MSGSATKRLISAYIQMASPMRFLSGLFQSPAQNFHNSEEVEIDIMRETEEVSVAIQDISAGHRMNSVDLYTNKGFKPPVHKEAVPINSFDLLKRMAGNTPFQDPAFQADLTLRMFDAMRKIENKIRRSIELQASQVLQTGTVTLQDSNGSTVYSIDFQPKATHFPTVGTAWSSATLAQKITDLTSLMNVIRNDGLMDPDRLIFGEAAWENLIATSGFADRFDARRLDLGTISPFEMRGQGGQYRGVIDLGNYRVDVWTYGGRYVNPNGGATTQYITPDKIIVQSSGGRLDATFGSVPNIGRLLGMNGTQILPGLPQRFTNAAGGMDLFTNAWVSADGEQLFGGIAARPLLIPTAIDTFGCLDVNL